MQLELAGVMDFQTFYARALFLQFFGPDFKSAKFGVPRGYFGNELTMSPEELVLQRVKKGERGIVFEDKEGQFTKAIKQAGEFLGKNKREWRYPDKIIILEGEKTTFGMTLVPIGQRDTLYIEHSFFKEYKRWDNGWLVKLMVYVLPTGLSYRSRKLLEFEYAREVFGRDQLIDLLGMDYLSELNRIRSAFPAQVNQQTEGLLRMCIAEFLVADRCQPIEREYK